MATQGEVRAVKTKAWNYIPRELWPSTSMARIGDDKTGWALRVIYNRPEGDVPNLPAQIDGVTVTWINQPPRKIVKQ